MGKKLLEKLTESTKSILPIALIVLILHFTIARMPAGTLALFLTGTVLLTVGMSIFTLGSDMATMPMGEAIGLELTKSKKIWKMLLGCFILGVTVTVAEPDLQVLTKQVPTVPDAVLVASVAAGVGVFLVLALLRILLQVRLSYLFAFFYALVFAVAALAAPDYLAVGFDSGGVTTGPITVPFILALGAGVSSVRGGRNEEEDSFGLCALCSIGPVLTVLLIGMFYDPSGSGYAFETAGTVGGARELLSLYRDGGLLFLKEVVLALLPVTVIFAVLQVTSLKLPKSRLIKIGVGLVYTIVGLTVFLTGVNIGFMPAGTFLGGAIASLPYRWILIPISMVIGFFITAAEPAVYLLNRQVEEITSGAISRKMMMTGLSLGIALALALSMVRIMTGTSIWFFLLPGYALALALSFFVPEIFTAIAFDSGGVAAGTMAAAFLLPFAMGACKALGGNVMTDAFGIIAMVAMLPLVTLQLMGLLYKIKTGRMKDPEASPGAEEQLFPEGPPEEIENTASPAEPDADPIEYSEEGNANGP